MAKNDSFMAIVNKKFNEKTDSKELRNGNSINLHYKNEQPYDVLVSTALLTLQKAKIIVYGKNAILHLNSKLKYQLYDKQHKCFCYYFLNVISNSKSYRYELDNNKYEDIRDSNLSKFSMNYFKHEIIILDNFLKSLTHICDTKICGSTRPQLEINSSNIKLIIYLTKKLTCLINNNILSLPTPYILSMKKLVNPYIEVRNALINAIHCYLTYYLIRIGESISLSVNNYDK